ncbi:3-isopropylmalate dehydratase large subunit [Budvicia aquatica]|uniref:3-isopropylmalate dehydratase large subunit n=1 Tax=Budvicia aquatica TaxID=82979 RepID=A0A484ZC69_9GAMM|nr:3-isopropylmalate dehydratase large subunit [Budvicia aquatica]
MLEPMVTWGISPDQADNINGSLPDPSDEKDPHKRLAQEKALAYMELAPKPA